MKRVLCLLPLALLTACATTPTAPRVAVMPAPGKPFEVFVAEDRLCRDFAAQSIGNTAEQTSQSAVNSAVVGTAVGAAAGALLGGHNGAAAGAGAGLLIGGANGASQTGYSSYDAQHRYDVAYQQCMYAKGNQLPAQYTRSYRSYDSGNSGAPAYYYPPPPPGPR
jgi:uncharacterized protein YcfJ